MTLLALFGPGSEWFWAMAQFLVLTVTGLAIYRQLRAQGSANALQAQAALIARWDSPEMVRVRLAALLEFASGATGDSDALILVSNFFAEMAALRTHRHIRPSDNWEIWSLQTQLWWAIVLPLIPAIRAKNEGIYGEFEELAGSMARLDLEKRVPNFGRSDLESYVERQISRLMFRLRIESDARKGVIPTRPARGSRDPDPPAGTRGTSRP